MLPDRYTATFTLGAGDTGADGRIPMPLLARRAIELATAHANILGVGYDALQPRGLGWVLSRMSIEVVGNVTINASYSGTTWVESYNRRFSERNFAFADAAGTPVAWIRSIWGAIDHRTRTGGDIGVFAPDGLPLAPLPCPIEPTRRIGEIGTATLQSQYTPRYCDLDFNRHVTTVRIFDLILDQWPLTHYDRFAPARMDILFHHECLPGQNLTIRAATDGTRSLAEIVHDGVRMVGAAINWAE